MIFLCLKYFFLILITSLEQLILWSRPQAQSTTTIKILPDNILLCYTQLTKNYLLNDDFHISAIFLYPFVHSWSIPVSFLDLLIYFLLLLIYIFNALPNSDHSFNHLIQDRLHFFVSLLELLDGFHFLLNQHLFWVQALAIDASSSSVNFF